MPVVDSEIEVVPFVEGDRQGVWNAIGAVWREFGSADLPERAADLNAIGAYYQAGTGGFWVAKKQRQVVGTIGLKDIGSRQMTLKRMYVLPEFRGTPAGAAGQRLLSTALRAAEENGVRSIYLGTPHFLTRAHRFYEKNGFRSIMRGELPPGMVIDPIDTQFYVREIGEKIVLGLTE